MPVTDPKKKSKIEKKLKLKEEKVVPPPPPTTTNNTSSNVIDIPIHPSTPSILNSLKGIKNMTKYQENKIRHLFKEKTIYEFNNKKYMYLNNDTLNQNFYFTLGKNGDNKPYEVRFCVFNINGKCKEPFLQFLLEINKTENPEKNLLTFPRFNLETEVFDDKEEDDVREIFEKKCFEQFKQYTHDVSHEVISASYRGFIEDDNNTIYVFFDSTRYNIKDNDQQVWCILDEIINEKKVFGNNYTDETILNMFNKNEFIAYITDEHGGKLNFPCCLYICKLNEEEDDYINVYVDDPDKDVDNYKILHYVFRNYCWFFTTDPIEREDLGKLRKIKRCASFIDKSLYILNISKDIDNINFDVDDENDSYQGMASDDIPKSHEKYSCIYFFENYKQMWCIKDPLRFTEIAHSS